MLCKSTSSPVVRTRARSARLATGKRIKSRRPHQSTQCLFCDGRCGSTSVQFRKAKLQYGQKHSRLARLERVAILLVSSCSTTLLHLPQAAQCREPSPVVVYLHLVHHTSLRFNRVIGRILHGKFLADYVCKFHEWERFYG